MNLETTLQAAARFTGLIGSFAAIAMGAASGPAAAIAIGKISNMGQAYLLMGARGAGRFNRLNRAVQQMVDENRNPSTAELEQLFNDIEEEENKFLGWIPPSQRADLASNQNK